MSFRLPSWVIFAALLVLMAFAGSLWQEIFGQPGGAERRAQVAQQQAEREADLRAQALAEAQAERRELSRALDATLRDQDAAAAAERVWRSDIAPLATSAEGRRIARSESLTLEMAHLFAGERPDTDALGELRRRAERVRSELGASPAGERVPADIAEETHELAAQAAEAARVWRDATDDARAITRQAERELGGEPPAEGPTLEQSMAERLDAERIAGMAKRREDAAAQADARAARASEGGPPSLDDQTLRALAPLLAARPLQPRLSGASVRLSATPDATPMSLSRLEAVGVLRDGDEGLKLLARVGAHRDLPAPRWGFPTEPGNWTPEDRRVLEAARAALKEHGAALVRAGSLAP